MSSLRRAIFAALFAGAIVAVAAAPAGAGQSTVSVSGVSSCNATTGNYDITWTITKTNNASSPTSVQSATQTPPGSQLVVTPNPIPADPNMMGALLSGTATSTLPGNTVGPVTLVVILTVGGTFTGAVTLDGACTVAAVAVAASPDFTG